MCSDPHSRTLANEVADAEASADAILSTVCSRLCRGSGGLHTSALIRGAQVPTAREAASGAASSEAIGSTPRVHRIGTGGKFRLHIAESLLFSVLPDGVIPRVSIRIER